MAQSYRSEHTPFDYDAVGENAAAALRNTAERLRKMNATSVVERGRAYKSTKDVLKHGQWVEWVTKETDDSPRTAQRMMRAADWSEGRSDTVSFLPAKALYELSAKETPEDVSKRILERLTDGTLLPKDVLGAVAEEILFERFVHIIQRESEVDRVNWMRRCANSLSLKIEIKGQSAAATA
jgi:hypothetical protein